MHPPISQSCSRTHWQKVLHTIHLCFFWVVHKIFPMWSKKYIFFPGDDYTVKKRSFIFNCPWSSGIDFCFLFAVIQQVIKSSIQWTLSHKVFSLPYLPSNFFLSLAIIPSYWFCCLFSTRWDCNQMITDAVLMGLTASWGPRFISLNEVVLSIQAAVTKSHTREEISKIHLSIIFQIVFEAEIVSP